MFEKQGTKIKTAFELPAGFYASVLVDIKKLLLNKQGQLPNYNGAIDFLGPGLPQASWRAWLLAWEVKQCIVRPDENKELLKLVIIMRIIT